MYKKIYDDLLEAIEKGIYPPGSKLPSEKELMEQYNVSRITSKKALEMLADRNIIVRMPGKGSFVLEENEQNLSGSLQMLLFCVTVYRRADKKTGNQYHTTGKKVCFPDYFSCVQPLFDTI